MNIIDILYDNKLSNLVYMRDITSYINQKSEAIPRNQVQDEGLDT